MAEIWRALTTKNLDKRLRQHDSMCKVHIYSGTRECSCGRDEARKELDDLLAEIRDLRAKLQPTLPGMPT